jgi:hypothetical protein
MAWFPGWDSVAGAHWWENFCFWLSIFALILPGIAEVVSHRYTERKDALSAIEQQQLQDKHDEDMAAVHLQAAKANERAEELQHENLEIRQKVAGRRISREQHDILIKQLSINPDTFAMETMTEGETTMYASDILKALNDTGWTLKDTVSLPLDKSWQGVTISLSTDPAASRLVSAFQAAGIPVQWFTEKRDIATVWVGAKPSPF